MTKACESCGMPLSKDPGKRESDRYCSYCYSNGRLFYEGNDLKEFQRVAYERMRAQGTSPILARLCTHMIRYAPRWRKAA